MLGLLCGLLSQLYLFLFPFPGDGGTNGDGDPRLHNRHDHAKERPSVRAHDASVYGPFPSPYPAPSLFPFCVPALFHSRCRDPGTCHACCGGLTRSKSHPHLQRWRHRLVRQWVSSTCGGVCDAHDCGRGDGKSDGGPFPFHDRVCCDAETSLRQMAPSCGLCCVRRSATLHRQLRPPRLHNGDGGVVCRHAFPGPSPQKRFETGAYADGGADERVNASGTCLGFLIWTLVATERRCANALAQGICC